MGACGARWRRSLIAHARLRRLKISPPAPWVSLAFLCGNFVLFLVLALVIDTLMPNDGRSSSLSIAAMLDRRRDRKRLAEMRRYRDGRMTLVGSDSDNDGADLVINAGADDNEREATPARGAAARRSSVHQSSGDDENGQALEPLLQRSGVRADDADHLEDVDQSVYDEAAVVQERMLSSTSGVYVDNVEKTYRRSLFQRSKDVRAVQGVSLAFELNTITAILGPNGGA